MTEKFEPAPFPPALKWAALILSLAALALVAWVIVSGVHAQGEATANGHRADAAIAQLHDERRDEAAREAADDQARQLLLTQVSALLAQVNDLQDRYGTQQVSYNHLLRYLRRHGIHIPTRYVIVPTATQRPSSSPSGGATSTSVPPAAQSAPAPVTPTPTLPNGKPAPGNSGNAPGHQKH